MLVLLKVTLCGRTGFRTVIEDVVLDKGMAKNISEVTDGFGVGIDTHVVSYEVLERVAA